MRREIKIGQLAEILRVHPRTILRATTGESNPSYHEGETEEMMIDEDEVCEKLQIPPKVWKRMKAGKDSFLKRKEVINLHGIATSTFKRRQYPIAAHFQRSCRYSEVDVNRHRILNFGDDLDDPKDSEEDENNDLKSIL